MDFACCLIFVFRIAILPVPSEQRGGDYGEARGCILMFDGESESSSLAVLLFAVILRTEGSITTVASPGR